MKPESKKLLTKAGRALRAAGLLPSKTEARRKLIEGAFHLDSERITDAALLVKVAQPTVLKVGKRRFLRLVP